MSSEGKFIVIFFQNTDHFCSVLSISGFNYYKDFNAEDVILDPGSFVYHILDSYSKFSQSSENNQIPIFRNGRIFLDKSNSPRQFSDAARAITYCDTELDQSTVSCQTAIKASPQNCGIYVPTAQGYDNSK